MRVPDQVLSCVFFLGVKTTDGHAEKWRYAGTGFAVSHADEELHFLYLVTAYHNIIDIGDREYVVRINTKDGNAREFLGNGSAGWRRHTDTSVDVAILPYYLLNETDVAFVATPMFMTDDNMRTCNVGVGSEVFITGLFTPHYGETRNQPIVRVGNVAMIPIDRVRVKDFGLMDAYLIESRSLGGLSGSPVFVIHYPQANRPYYFEFLLMGVIQGHWNKNLESSLASATQEEKAANMGVAIVTPAKKILDLINQPEIAAHRTAEKERIRARAKEQPIHDNKQNGKTS